MVYLLTSWCRYSIVYTSGEDTISNLVEVNKDVRMDSVVVNGIRYKVVKATKQELVMANVSLLLSSKRSSVSLLKTATKFRQPFQWLFGI